MPEIVPIGTIHTDDVRCFALPKKPHNAACRNVAISHPALYLHRKLCPDVMFMPQHLKRLYSIPGPTDIFPLMAVSANIPSHMSVHFIVLLHSIFHVFQYYI